jgi:hypothetical protein
VILWLLAPWRLPREDRSAAEHRRCGLEISVSKGVRTECWESDDGTVGIRFTL